MKCSPGPDQITRRISATGKPICGRSVMVFIITLMLFLWNFHEISAQHAVMKEEIVSIKTYPYSDPNPVPAMAVNAMVSPFYPWFEFNGYSNEGQNKDWKVITLENEFIRLSILPGVGGKVWGAVEKSTGREFIYQNHVLKFRAIGIRGPWTSGGIEHNFGLDLGHAPWTSSAVDYLLKVNPDSSATCYVGGLDLASRTQWRVAIHLPKDKAYFETWGMWYNPTPLHDAYLSWENAAFKAAGDLQFCFPGTCYIGHNGAVNPWPLDAGGHNLSRYRENNFGSSKSYHVSGLFTQWFGGYWHDDDFGFGHYAPYADAPGKKIWIWSLARDGAIWEDLLTDHDGQYIEAQSGVKFNQANRESGFNSPFDQISMRPYYTETKTEYWFPVKNTKGMVDASPEGALNVIFSKDSLTILISANTVIQDSISVTLWNKSLYSFPVHISPMQLYRMELPLPRGDLQSLRISVGNNLLSYTPGTGGKKTDRPFVSSADQQYNSAEHLFLLAEDENAMRNYTRAMEYYLACLRQEPSHCRALSKAAELSYRRGEYEDALRYACRVLENNTYDAGANFISGVVNRRLGNLVQAEEEFSIAARTMEYRSGSYVEIAGIKMQQHDYPASIQCAAKALDYNRLNVKAYEIITTGYRKLNDLLASARTVKTLFETDPLDHYGRFEQFLMDPTDENMRDFKASIRNELPYETYLEIALEYSELGLEEEAIRVLEQSPPYPVVYYWLAYLYRNSSREKSNGFLEQAEEMSAFLVFPFRQETIPALSWALDRHDCWKTRYYLGLIYWHMQQTEKARELFEQCGDIPDYAPFYIARAVLFQHELTTYCYPCNDFGKAVRLAPGEWRTWHYLSNILQSSGSFQNQLDNAKQAYMRFPDHPVIGIDYAKALFNTGKFKECLSILSRVTILPQEGAHEGHDIYETANLALAVEKLEHKRFREAIKYLNVSRIWPENLGAGKPYEPDTRFQDYLSGYCYRRLGNKALEDTFNSHILRYSAENWGSAEPTNIYIALQGFAEQGKQQETIPDMEKWQQEQDSLRNWRISPGSDAPEVQWVLAKFRHEEEKAAKLEKELVSLGIENRFSLVLKTMKIINQYENEK
jgi:tetratricopeptide (TPR) repeat protein